MFANPLKILKSVGLHDDNIVADVGAGTGNYSVLAGHLVPRGKVYAIELQKEFLPLIKSKLNEQKLHNVEVIWGNAEKKGGTQIANNIADFAIVSNVLFQVEDKDQFVSEINRILKPKGRVLVVDWADGSIVQGKKIITAPEAETMFSKKGFTKERMIDAGGHHYGMIFIKQ